jgi:hypothetical protein
VLFTVVGVWLEVGSSVLLGLALVVFGVHRWSRGDRLTAPAASFPSGRPPLPRRSR